jgi:hypothetical protein
MLFHENYFNVMKVDGNSQLTSNWITLLYVMQLLVN